MDFVKYSRKRTMMVLFLLILGLFWQRGYAEPLTQVITSVINTHPDIESAQNLLEAAGQRINQARSGFFPTVGLGVSLSDATGDQLAQSITQKIRRTDAIVQWTIFNGFANRYELDKNQEERAAAAAQLDATRDAVALEVTDQYLSVLRYFYQFQRSNAYIKGLSVLVKSIETRAEHGRLSMVHTAQARSRLIQAENEHARLRGRLNGAKARFEAITGQKPRNLVYPRISPSIAEAPVEALLEQAMSNNPNLRAADERAKAKQAEIQIAKSGLMPSITLEMRKRLQSHVEPASLFDEDQRSAIQLSYELPLGNGVLAQTAAAEKLRQAALADKRAAALEIRSGLATLQLQLQEELRIRPRLKENITATKRVVDAYTLQFDAGKRSLLDLLIAWSDRYRAQVAQIDNWYEVTLLTAQVHALTGDLRKMIESDGRTG